MESLDGSAKLDTRCWRSWQDQFVVHVLSRGGTACEQCAILAAVSLTAA
jgi:DNA polymerase IIIc chi subunit